MSKGAGQLANACNTKPPFIIPSSSPCRPNAPALLALTAVYRNITVNLARKQMRNNKEGKEKTITNTTLTRSSSPNPFSLFVRFIFSLLCPTHFHFHFHFHILSSFFGGKRKRIKSSMSALESHRNLGQVGIGSYKPQLDAPKKIK